MMNAKIFVVSQDLKVVDEIVPVLKDEGFFVNSSTTPGYQIFLAI